jgi:hypothetical protein
MECGEEGSEKPSPVINPAKKVSKVAESGKDNSANMNKKGSVSITNRFSALQRTPPPPKPPVKDGAAG